MEDYKIGDEVIHLLIIHKTKGHISPSKFSPIPDDMTDVEIVKEVGVIVGQTSSYYKVEHKQKTRAVASSFWFKGRIRKDHAHATEHEAREALMNYCIAEMDKIKIQVSGLRETYKRWNDLQKAFI